MILSASRRTDIPCFYSEWLLNRLREGAVMTRNPLNPRQVSRIPLSPDWVDVIVFWTKNPLPMLHRLDELDELGYRYLFQFTLTPYGREWEPGLPDKETLTDAFRAFSARLGPGRLVWRYDPIIISGAFPLSRHRQAFSALCARLEGYTDEVIISFVDPYRKLGTRISSVPPDDMAALAAYTGETAPKYGMAVSACCEAMDLTPYGIGRASCIDKNRLERICGASLSLGPDKNQRPGCGCYESIDIGAYDTCPNGCIYCYANRSVQTVARNHASHDPVSPFLLGEVQPEDRVKERAVRSHIVGQTSLF